MLPFGFATSISAFYPIDIFILVVAKTYAMFVKIRFRFFFNHRWFGYDLSLRNVVKRLVLLPQYRSTSFNCLMLTLSFFYYIQNGLRVIFHIDILIHPFATFWFWFVWCNILLLWFFFNKYSFLFFFTWRWQRYFLQIHNTFWHIAIFSIFYFLYIRYWFILNLILISFYNLINWKTYFIWS